MLEGIESKMEKLSKKIEYEFKDISLLKKAMFPPLFPPQDVAVEVKANVKQALNKYLDNNFVFIFTS